MWNCGSTFHILPLFLKKEEASFPLTTCIKYQEQTTSLNYG